MPEEQAHLAGRGVGGAGNLSFLAGVDHVSHQHLYPSKGGEKETYRATGKEGGIENNVQG